MPEPNDKSIRDFDKEYSPPGKKRVEPKELTDLDVDQYGELKVDQYGLNKPEEIIIKAKIIHDNNQNP